MKYWYRHGPKWYFVKDVSRVTVDGDFVIFWSRNEELYLRDVVMLIVREPGEVRHHDMMSQHDINENS